MAGRERHGIAFPSFFSYLPRRINLVLSVFYRTSFYFPKQV